MKHHGVKAPDGVVREARELYAGGGWFIKDLAARYGEPEGVVRDWVRGRCRIEAGGPIVAPTPRRKRKPTQLALYRDST